MTCDYCKRPLALDVKERCRNCGAQHDLRSSQAPHRIVDSYLDFILSDTERMIVELRRRSGVVMPESNP